jgi:hypothetical protein
MVNHFCLVGSVGLLGLMLFCTGCPTATTGPSDSVDESAVGTPAQSDQTGGESPSEADGASPASSADDGGTAASGQPPASAPPGDLDGDGVTDPSDIRGFVLALVDVDAFLALYPDGDPLLADINGDGAVNAFDIDPFVLLLTGK